MKNITYTHPLLFTLLVGSLFLMSCTQQSNSIDTVTSDKEQAREFALTIVKSYFDKDCDTLYNALQEPVRVLDNQELFEKNAEFKEWLCTILKVSYTGNHTFEEYVDSYTIMVFNQKEYEARFLPDLPHWIKPTPHEYLFYGFQVKKGKNNFMSDDLLGFMVKKTEEGWKVSSLNS